MNELLLLTSHFPPVPALSTRPRGPGLGGAGGGQDCEGIWKCVLTSLPHFTTENYTVEKNNSADD